MDKIKYIIGERIGECAYMGNEFSKNWRRYATFQCKCGNTFITTITKVKSGHSKSCGCLAIEKVVAMNKTHGASRSKEFNTWVNIRQRCNNENNNSHDRYGARGIKVCLEWEESFENFYNDMGKAPSDKHSIERINNQLGYFKGNCRWATNKEQANNRRSNIIVTYNNQTKTLKQWSELLRLDYGLVVQRIKKLKWPPEKAFQTNKRCHTPIAM